MDSIRCPRLSLGYPSRPLEWNNIFSIKPEWQILKEVNPHAFRVYLVDSPDEFSKLWDRLSYVVTFILFPPVQLVLSC